MSSDLAWPFWMPRPQATGYTYEPVDRSVSSEMDVGTIRRVEFDTDETVITCNVVLTRYQAAFLDAYERDWLNQGCKWFVMPIWIAGEVDEYLVRFKERPKIGNFIGLHATASLTLEIEKRNLLDDDIMELLFEYDPEDVADASSYLHYVLHTVAPGCTVLPRL